YPLTPYLDIWQARKALQKNNDQLAANALARYADIPESRNLRVAWLKSLARRGHWSRIDKMLQSFPKLASRFPDIAMRANWHVGDKGEAMRQFSKRWQHGKQLPLALATLQQAWHKQGHPTEAERWNRIDRLGRHGQWKKLRKLTKSLSKQQRQWLKYWRSVQNAPQKALQHLPASMPPAQTAMIVSDGIKRLSRRDAVKAWLLLKQLESNAVQVKGAYLLELERHTALRAARQHKPEAAGWLADLPAPYQNEDTRGWRTRVSILQHDWPNILTAIAAMPESEQQQSRWIYWAARAAEGTGQPEAARHLFAKLASERGYYSFLSAERIKQPLRFNASEITATDDAIAAIRQKPAVRRAHEWLSLGKRSKAAREWYHALASASPEQWQAAAVLASRWHWHDQVIRAAFKANQLDAISDRFPLAFEKAVMRASRKTGLTAASIWSIIRQESAFNQYAVSYVGAKGLMQLMPKTARHVARKLGMGKKMPRLFSPAVNIRLGSTYLAAQKTRFGNLALAAAAYNAGPHRVSRWLKRTPFDAPEAWVEAIAFSETRRYVQQVMAFVSVYEWRQKKPASSLTARLNERIQKISLNEKALINHAIAKGGNHLERLLDCAAK
ncbi:MAG: transglycosylase SLT domain-containing protein, partial [Mariprofundus sp.]|nr:transglycosylase SLT domain-containing protein [Mariprofundus sp.]